MIADSHCHLDYENLYSQLDDVIKRAEINNVTYLLTICTTLDSFEKIKVCTSYTYRDRKYDYLPLEIDNSSQIITNYVELDGWKEKTRGTRRFSDLPINAKKYISFIEDFIGIPVTMLSTSPEREDTILFQDPFTN